MYVKNFIHNSDLKITSVFLIFLEFSFYYGYICKTGWTLITHFTIALNE